MHRDQQWVAWARIRPTGASSGLLDLNLNQDPTVKPSGSPLLSISRMKAGEFVFWEAFFKNQHCPKSATSLTAYMQKLCHITSMTTF